jgi:hypothetical protein
VSYPDSQPGRHRGPVMLEAARGRLERTATTQGPQFTAARRRLALSPEDRAEAAKVLRAGGGCFLCGGLHAGSELACPRLATFTLSGDGVPVQLSAVLPDGQVSVRTVYLSEGTFWPNGTWEDPERVILAEDANETTDDTANPG